VPRVSRWFIRTAMMYLVAALLLGAVMQSPLAARVPLLQVLWPTYVHLLVVGWLTQLIFGVAYWMFPRYSAERRAIPRVGGEAGNAGLYRRRAGSRRRPRRAWYRLEVPEQG
jgi:hypothetical protein